MKIQIMIHGKRREPLDWEALRKAHGLGQIPAHALAWDETASRWAPVADLLASRTSAAPPEETSLSSSAAHVWHYRVPGSEPVGPVTEDDLRALIIAGTVPMNALVFRRGAATWIPVSDAPEFQPQPNVYESAVAPGAGNSRKKSPGFSPAGAGPANGGNRPILRNIVALGGIAAGVFFLLLLTYTPVNSYRSADGRWKPLPGYVWRNDVALFKMAVWKAGIAHSLITHLHAAKTEGTWVKDLGFEVIPKDGDFSVVWMSGEHSAEHAHVFAGGKSEIWWPDPGYDWVDPKQSLNVHWQAGLNHPAYRNLVSKEAEGTWVWGVEPEPGPTPAAMEDVLQEIVDASFTDSDESPGGGTGILLAGVPIWDKGDRNRLVAGEIEYLFPQLSGVDVDLATTEIAKAIDGQFSAQDLAGGREKQILLAQLQAHQVSDGTAAEVVNFVWRAVQAIVNAG